MLAVIQIGGKQYIVSPAQKIKINPINKKAGSEITFNKVLLLEKQRKIEIGTPFVKEAKVTGKVLRHGKEDKVIVFKFRRKTRYKVKKGYREQFTEIEITKIES